MGSGKTEAALTAYLHWARSVERAGLYIAMPTTATSNQMHQRVKVFLCKQYGATIEPLLIHSQALLSQMPPGNDSVGENDEQEDQAAVQTWFLPRKKSLLAPFGVGTVDQALMSVLQTKHFFVRLLGLSHKVVIFDEVHAYDAYMSVLFERLLVWLRQIGASVIVLSATLPNETRKRLLSAYSGNADLPPTRPYPRLTFAGASGEVDAIELTPPPEKVLAFEWVSRDPQSLVQRLSEELREGGCAAVICNTVTRAQQLFEAVDGANLCDEDNRILFHARFPLAWREGIEQKVLDKFGPNKEDKKQANPHRPYKAIVIATQVIEQSLDLDFDVMISDHAPVDLLLQRAGRLHRHSVNNTTRRNPYRLLIAEPSVNEGIPQFERGDKFVYDEYVLLCSWLALQSISAKEIRLPSDLSNLIEQVYGDAPLPASSPEFQATLSKAKSAMGKGEHDEKFNARLRIVRLPDEEELLWGDNAALEEDDPAVHATFQALTRADRPGLNVICLHRVGEKLFLEPDSSGAEYDPAVQLTDELTYELARRSAMVRRPDIEKYLLTEPSSPAIQAILKQWKKVALLRYHRVAIFTESICHLEGAPYVLRLTRKFGLQIAKEV
jgi:CRISPR-associated endonuclease/helicase Cas3